MALTYDKLAAFLPSGAIDQNTLHLSALGSANISIVNWLVALLDGTAKLTEAVNTERQAQTPPLDPIDLATKSVSINGDDVTISFTINFIGSLSNINSTVIDPTVPPAALPTTSTPTTAPTNPGSGTNPGAPVTVGGIS